MNSTAPPSVLLSRLLRYSRTSSDFTIRVLRGLVWPKVDFLIRLALAEIFFVSGVLKLTHWSTALDLAANEYPVSFLSPVRAAYLGVAIEVIGSVLLVLGFMTRYAAVPMLVLSLVIQFAYKPFDSQLFWAVLFGWYAVVGAGHFSMDHLLRRGLADSALPVVPSILKFSHWLRVRVGPVYVSVLRIWLATALLVYATHVTRPSTGVLGTLASLLPLGVVAHLPEGVALAGGALLLLGLGTRYLAAAMIATLALTAMIDPRETDAVYLLMTFAILIVFGGGELSLDRLLRALLDRYFPHNDMRDPRALEGLPRVVIVGAGFAGLSCAAALRHARVAVTLIDRANFHLFQPLLYQVATAGISPGDIASPIRQLFRNAFNVRVLLGTVTGIDAQARIVKTDRSDIPYDHLVLATGATHSYFGKDAWAQHAPGLKRIEDALEIRRRILTAFEQAEAAGTPEERASLLTFLIVGGGPTGVELAGAIAELAHHGMDKQFRTFDPAEARVILVQSGPRLLPAFPERLSAIAQRSLEQLGIEVLLNSRVQAIDGEGVAVGGKRIVARTVLWAAGVMASPAARWLNAPADNAGRVVVAPDLSVTGFSNVYAIGDTAASNAWNGQPVPGLAPAAKQAGAYVARLIRAKVEGRPVPAAFRYKHLGSLATIGRKSAVVDFKFVKLWGAPAWWLWGLVHVSFLVGLRNRVATMVNWFWAYLT
ncbi:MAG TPA: FAD-dependent oxidoreductase, partial [Steroidobacteraceae bacterium]|nr:FAD-dependent oxidoreductase [Steroidobacteraceae bacterium]